MATPAPGQIVGPCAECRFWHRHERTNWMDRTDWGECWLFSDDASDDSSRPAVEHKPEPLALVCPFAGADGASVDTHATFGCLQWERKPANGFTANVIEGEEH